MTENGWDRLAYTEVGFHGGILSSQRELNYADQNWGPANWEPYPLSLWLFHDKVLVYQHDLARTTMTHDKEVLRWNMVFGVMLSYNWETDESLNSPWLDLVGAFQHSVGSRYAGQSLRGYTRSGDITHSTFANLTIIGNWNASLPHDVLNHRLAPGGFLAEANDSAVVAGVFVDLFNGNRLSGGEHYLIVDRQASVVDVRQPIGSDTRLAVRTPDDWQTGRSLEVWALGHTGSRLGTVPFSMEGHDVKFNYTQAWKDGQPVVSYQIVLK